MSTLTHTCWHSLSHTLSHFFIQHMLFCLVTRRWWITMINAASGAPVAWWTKCHCPLLATLWETDNVLLPCEGQHHTVAIYAKCKKWKNTKDCQLLSLLNYTLIAGACSRGGACPTSLVVITFCAIFFKIYKATNYTFLWGIIHLDALYVCNKEWFR